jgi:hypothetical protein
MIDTVIWVQAREAIMVFKRSQGSQKQAITAGLIFLLLTAVAVGDYAIPMAGYSRIV